MGLAVRAAGIGRRRLRDGWERRRRGKEEASQRQAREVSTVLFNHRRQHHQHPPITCAFLARLFPPSLPCSAATARARPWERRTPCPFCGLPSSEIGIQPHDPPCTLQVQEAWRGGMRCLLAWSWAFRRFRTASVVQDQAVPCVSCARSPLGVNRRQPGRSFGGTSWPGRVMVVLFRTVISTPAQPMPQCQHRTRLGCPNSLPCLRGHAMLANRSRQGPNPAPSDCLHPCLRGALRLALAQCWAELRGTLGSWARLGGGWSKC